MDKITEFSYNLLIDKGYKKHRTDKKVDITDIQLSNDDLAIKVANRLKRMVEQEEAIVYKEDRISFKRTIKDVPDILTPQEREELSKEYLLFDGGIVFNISSNYENVLEKGFNQLLKEVEEQVINSNPKEKALLDAMKSSILSTYTLVEKYKNKALEVGNTALADILTKVPYNKPTSYHEALVFLRILNYMLWLNGNKHNTVGRFDQYMYPYYKKDIEEGKINEEQALSLTEEFFISLNFDADLYPGIQQGDNGQSLMLGGCKKDGTSAFNELTELSLKASLELKLIDPKINLRVSKDTEDKWYQLGTLLTKQGLGFPQYSNDDVVIPALVKWGYDLEDARDYAVAACWEFIIPGKGMDVANLDALSFPKMVNLALNDKRFLEANSYDELVNIIYDYIEKEVYRLVDYTKNLYIIPSPFQSLLMDGCIENKKDISLGGKYNNYGFHGAGLSTAVDSLSAIKKNVFEDKTISKEELLLALENNFEGHESIRKLLINSPKMGDNDDFADDIACKLLHKFSIECSKYKNTRGGMYRAGTGSAMYYIWYSQELGATADGRRSGEPFGANYSPSLSQNFKGVLSVIKSFTKPNLEEVCNGGPLTLEFHDTLFRNEDGITKVANLVKTFVLLGGHQLQLNSLNKEKLLDAQKHPENYKNLIVRVWGWSGYFNELDVQYQNHIIKRTDFTF